MFEEEIRLIFNWIYLLVFMEARLKNYQGKGMGNKNNLQGEIICKE